MDRKIGFFIGSLMTLNGSIDFFILLDNGKINVIYKIRDNFYLQKEIRALK